MFTGDEEATRAFVRSLPYPHIVYVLRRPDGICCWGGVGTPFYVGDSAQGNWRRPFSHLKRTMARKIRAEIHEITASGQDIVFSIDSWFPAYPGTDWTSLTRIRESQLIERMGIRHRHVNGILANTRLEPWDGRSYAELRRHFETHGFIDTAWAEHPGEL